MFKENAVIENRLVWSAHRMQCLARCERKYYHAYIGSWLGWNTDSSPEGQCSYRLKHLTTPELEIGNILHAQIRLIFCSKAQAGRTVQPATEIKIAQAQFRDFVEHSSRRRLEDLTSKRRKLFLHEMGQTVTAEAMAEYEAWIALLFERFFGFADVKRLLADSTPIFWDYLDPAGFAIGHELGAPARPKTDAVFLESDTVVIADWKCGAPSEEHRRQGLVYELYVRHKMNLLPERPVEVRFYYLATGEMEAFRFCEEEKQEMLWQIGEDFASLQRMSDDPIINVGPEDRFRPSVSNACFYCNFRVMCEPFLQSKLAVKKGGE